MTNKLYITSNNVNLEIIAKLLNSVAEKYGCYVKYDLKENSLNFIGDQDYWKHIIEEVVAFFFPQIDKAVVRLHA